MAFYSGKRKRKTMPRGMGRALRQQRYAISKMDPTERARQYGYTYRQRLLDNTLPAMTPLQRNQRLLTNYRGDGDYRSIGRGIARWGGGAIGAGLGYMSGGVQGAATGFQRGWDTGASASKYVGLGDYGPPVSNQISGGMGAPITVNASDDLTGDVYISHTEFVGNVSASATAAGASIFQQSKFALNAGLQSTFPFLSQIASNFEMYDFMGLMFEYRPTSGENATANSLGKVMMATNYDPDAPDWLNSVQLMNYDYSSSTKPSVGMVHGVETANKQQAVNMMYIRTNNDTTKSRVFTDLGNFYVCTEGVPFTAAGTQILGELWVTYRIKLSRAALYQSMLGLNQPFDYYTGVSTAASMFGTTTPIGRPSDAGLWTLTSGATVVDVTASPRLMAGCYQWVLLMQDSGTPTVSNVTLTNLINCAPVNQRAASGTYANLIFNVKAGGLPTMVASGYISVNNTTNVAPNFRITLNGTGLTAGGIFYTLSISQVPCTIVTSSGATAL
nr:capsid protein [Circovirus sp.]